MTAGTIAHIEGLADGDEIDAKTDPTFPDSDPYTAVQQNTAPPNPNSLPTGGTLQKTMRL